MARLQIVPLPGKGSDHPFGIILDQCNDRDVKIYTDAHAHAALKEATGAKWTIMTQETLDVVDARSQLEEQIGIADLAARLDKVAQAVTDAVDKGMRNCKIIVGEDGAARLVAA